MKYFVEWVTSHISDILDDHNTSRETKRVNNDQFSNMDMFQLEMAPCD